MPAYTCPHCRKPFTAATATARCPHCAERAGDGARTFKPKRATRRPFPWLLAGLAGTGASALLAIVLVIAFLYSRNARTIDEPNAKKDQAVIQEKKDRRDLPKRDDGAAIKVDPPVKKDADKKKPPNVIKSSQAPQIEQFVERLNRHRLAAGLGAVTLDAELSRGCSAHAKYLATHLDPDKADGSNVFEEDAKKPGYSAEGERAAAVAIVGTLEPMAALERWMGRLLSRAPLLNPEIQTIGVGAERNAAGRWYCVVDTQRGRGEPIVVYPGPKQLDVPISYSGGPELPENTPGGFPISVAFPPSKKVTSAQMELRGRDGAPIAGQLFTPEKPALPEQKLNAMAIIPNALLEGNTLYQVKASAQLDGKPWNLAWSFTTEDDIDRKGLWAKKALDKINTYRASAGLKPVALDDKLSQGCLKHARYLVINEGHKALLGLNAHTEDLKLPGASPEGDAAGKASNIGIGDYEPIDAIDAWMATLYHRVPLLAPNLKTIGVACARGRRQGWATVMNVQTGREKAPVGAVYYPAPDQVGVPLTFPNSGEEPNPIPEDGDGRAGYPITATFPRDAVLQNAIGSLTTDKGDMVPSWFSSPEKPANPKHAKAQGSTVSLIARAPLSAHSTYHVQIKGTLAGKPFEKKWKFTTGDAGLSVGKAVRTVVERANHFRGQVGLKPVVLDEEQTRGCQLHAEYLAKNADALLKLKAPVNDENPELPWFTAEGLRAARQSMTFTNAPTPAMQIDDLMGSFTGRFFVLDPSLQRVGIGCAHDIGRGWRSVFDPNGGRGDSRVILYPAPMQTDVPLLGFDRLGAAQGNVGFPISVIFPQRARVGKADAVLMDAQDKSVNVWISSPDKPLNEKLQRTTVGVHPLEPLVAGQTYSITVSAIVNSKEWRQAWQFTTAK